MLMGAKLMRQWFDGQTVVDKTSVTIDWTLTFSRAKKVYDSIVNEKLYANAKAQDEILKLAEKYGVYNEKGGKFGSIVGDIALLASESIQYRNVGSMSDPIDDMLAALGHFKYRVLVEGYVLRGRKTRPRTFCISKIGIFLSDSYDFNDEPGKDQFLGFWNAQSNYVGRNLFLGDAVYNSDFRAYRKEHNKGKDYLIYSNIAEHKISPSAVFYK